MKDLHCHLLPALDDGAQTFADTEEMLKTAAASGIGVIAATSHYSPEMEPVYEGTWAKAGELAGKYHIRLLRGTEYDLEYIADVPKEKLRPVEGTKYLLVDMNRNYIVHAMTNLFFELKLAGFQIIFAHPERMLPLRELKVLLKLLEENAILIQMDSGSIVGRYGEQARSNARYLLDRGGCHFLGNDAHKAGHFMFRECRAILEKRYGQGLFELLTEENPSALLTGGEINPSPQRKSFWERFFRRES